MISRADTVNINSIGTEDRIDAILDRALEATFPASDPVAFPLGHGASVQDNRYPVSLISRWNAPDGTPVTIRPVRPDENSPYSVGNRTVPVVERPRQPFRSGSVGPLSRAPFLHPKP